MPDVRLGQHFEEGSTVGAWPRTGDFFPGHGVLGGAVKTAKASSDGVVFRGLEKGRYWAARTDGKGGHVGFWSKDVEASKRRVEPAARSNPQAHPVVRSGVQIVTGPRGTVVKNTDHVVETPIGRGQEPNPSLNQASVGAGVPQRSATPLGQATPVDPDELQPKPAQEHAGRNARQRSDTELGESTVIAGDAGPARQEDFKGWQRSDTETGEATPIGSAEPRGTSVNPSSEEQAEGVRSTDGERPERSARSDTSGPNPEVVAEGRRRPRPQARQSRSSSSKK